MKAPLPLTKESKQELFAALPIPKDPIEVARGEMQGFLGSRDATLPHLNARRSLLRALKESLGELQKQTAEQKIVGIKRIESVLSELGQEMAQNPGTLPRGKTSQGDLDSRVNELKSLLGEVTAGIQTANTQPDVVAFIKRAGEESRGKAEAQSDFNEKAKAGKIENLKKQIGSNFDSKNPNHEQAAHSRI